MANCINRLELEADLRRGRVAEVRVVVVAQRAAQLEPLGHRRVQLAVHRLDVALHVELRSSPRPTIAPVSVPGTAGVLASSQRASAPSASPSGPPSSGISSRDALKSIDVTELVGWFSSTGDTAASHRGIGGIGTVEAVGAIGDGRLHRVVDDEAVVLVLQLALGIEQAGVPVPAEVAALQAHEASEDLVVGGLVTTAEFVRAVAETATSTPNGLSGCVPGIVIGGCTSSGLSGSPGTKTPPSLFAPVVPLALVLVLKNPSSA